MWLRRMRQDPAALLVVCVSALVLVGAALLTRRGAPLPPDALEYAEVARSLQRGQGYTINLVEIHAGLLGSIRHLHELHGLLQPLLIAPFFAVFGSDPAFVRLPGLVAVTGIVLVSFSLARSRFGTIAALVAAALALTRLDLALMGVLGGDDVGWALFSSLSVFCFLKATESPALKWSLLAGTAAGLATLEKFSGIALPVVFVLTALCTPKIRGSLGARAWASVAVPVALAAAAYALRNYLLHGSLGFRFSALDWLSKQDPMAYFALYESPPRLTAVWAKMGLSTITRLTVHQLHVLGTAALEDPFVLIGGPMAVVALVRRDRAFAMLGLTYSVVLVGVVCFVYHVEMRYLFALHPIFFGAIGAHAAAALEALSRRVPESRTRLFKGALALACGSLALALTTRVLAMHQKVGAAAGSPGTCDDAISFIRATAGASEPVATSSPWFVAWSTERPAVVVPTNGVEEFVRVAHHYRVQWAVEGLPSYGTGDVALVIQALSRGAHEISVERAFDGAVCDVYRLRGVLAPE